MQLTMEQLPDGVEKIALADRMGHLRRHRGKQLRPRTAERVDLYSTEVVTNIMTYACAGHDTQQISLRLESQPNALALEIQDDGSPFDPRQADEPQLAAIQSFRHFSDELHYRRTDGRNHLTLTFQLPPLLPL